MTRWFFSFAVLVLLAMPAAAQDFDKGLEAANLGDYATALREWHPIAEYGNAKAQYNLGVMYDFGKGVPQNYREAMKWYLLAADQGNAEAQANLGVMFAMGNGVLRDDAEAVKWYRMAAEQGNANAQSNLGTMYYSGKGVPQDKLQALMWLTLSALTGQKAAAENRNIVARSMDAAQVTEARKMARAWLTNHKR